MADLQRLAQISAQIQIGLQPTRSCRNIVEDIAKGFKTAGLIQLITDIAIRVPAQVPGECATMRYAGSADQSLASRWSASF